MKCEDDKKVACVQIWMEKMIGDADDQIYEPNDVAPHHRPCAGHSFYKRYLRERSKGDLE